jgi:RHS repeat-associated protein
MWSWDPDTFGSVNPNVNPSGFGTFNYNLRFPGQYFLAETGLNYNYFRTYDPQMGRHIESDPIGLKGGSYSAYVYANANPISNFDPTGLASAADEARAMGLTSPPPPDCPRCQGSDRWSYTPPAPCASGDAMCGIAMQAAGISGPYYSTTHVVSRKCMMTAGLLVPRPGDFDRLKTISARSAVILGAKEARCCERLRGYDE